METIECLRCNQKAIEEWDYFRIFKKPALFGEEDELAFHQQPCGRWLCGTCAMDEVSPMQLAEYGWRRNDKQEPGKKYIQIEPARRPFAQSLDDIPRQYRWSSISRYDRTVQRLVIEWISSNKSQCVLLGESRDLAWAILREFLRAGKPAMMMAHQEMADAMIQEEQHGKTYFNSPTVLAAKRAQGILVLEDVMGPMMTRARADWVASILTDRMIYGRKTLLSIQPNPISFQTAIIRRVRDGILIPTDEWGREFVAATTEKEEVAR